MNSAPLLFLARDVLANQRTNMEHHWMVSWDEWDAECYMNCPHHSVKGLLSDAGTQVLLCLPSLLVLDPRPRVIQKKKETERENILAVISQSKKYTNSSFQNIQFFQNRQFLKIISLYKKY